MRRARKPLPPSLWHLKYNPLSGYYEVIEDQVVYKMQIEETRSLKDYFRDFKTEGGTKFPSIHGWYTKLPNHTKKRVIREGQIVENESNGFYPDISHD